LLPSYNGGMMNKSEQARAVMLEHHLNCAQSGDIYLLREFGWTGTWIKSGEGFGADGTHGKTCGAVSRCLYDSDITENQRK